MNHRALLAALMPLLATGCSPMDHAASRVGLLVLLPSALVIGAFWLASRRHGRLDGRRRNRNYPDFDNRG